MISAPPEGTLFFDPRGGQFSMKRVSNVIPLFLAAVTVPMLAHAVCTPTAGFNLVDPSQVLPSIPCSRENPKILRVDDTEVVRDLIAISLPISGYAVS